MKEVDPDVRIEVFPKENMINGRMDAIRKLVDMIEKNK